jgi:choline transport protein
MIQGLVAMNHADYAFQRWHGTLIFYGIVMVSLFVNTYLARLLPEIEAVVLLLHIIGFFCVLIPLVYLAPHGSARDVFATFNNADGWGDKGLSFFVGLSTSMFSFIGCDAGSHMGGSPVTCSLPWVILTHNAAEEIQTAPTVVPRSMITSVLLNGTLGFAMVIAALFCLGDAEAALESETGFPFMEVFLNATGTRLGATLMVRCDANSRVPRH